MAYRTKFIDYDARPEPKTNTFCIMCQRDLKPTQKRRIVEFELDTFHAIHIEDLDVARREITRPLNIELIGADCAKRLGLEYSRPMEVTA